MFQFSIEKTVRPGASTGSPASHAITEDPDWAERLKNTGEYRENERYFRAENENPDSVEKAVEFVQGIFFHPPTRVWIDDKEYTVTESIEERVRKPVAPGESVGRTGE